MKKLISILLSALMITSVICSAPFAVSAVAEETETAGAAENTETAEVGANSGTTGECTWTLDDNGVLTISGNGAMANYSYYGNMPWGAYIKNVVIEN